MDILKIMIQQSKTKHAYVVHPPLSEVCVFDVRNF